MKKSYLPALVAGLCLSASVAAAPRLPVKDLPFYWGVSFSWLNYSQEGWDDEAENTAITGRFGYQFLEWLAMEARYSHGIRTDGVILDGTELDVDVKNAYGLYGKINLLTDINFSPYLLLGYAQAEADGTVTGFETMTNDDNGLSYAVGVDFCKDNPVCLNLEYMQYLDEDSLDLSGLNVGLRIRF